MTPAINGFSSSRFGARCQGPRGRNVDGTLKQICTTHLAGPFLSLRTLSDLCWARRKSGRARDCTINQLKSCDEKKICYAAFFADSRGFPRIFHRFVSTFKKSICNCWLVHFPQFFIIGPIQEEHFVVLKMSFGPNWLPQFDIAR